jgi:Mn-dependent DtxR family transcriptional regulator
MTEKFYILRTVEEDVLRILAEKKKKVLLDSIKTKVKVSSFFISKALKELEREKLIETEENFIKLTKIGQEKSKIILRKHLVLENYFKKTLNKRVAHRKAHILEHYVSEEVIKNIKKLHTLKERGTSLTKLKLHKESLIADINILNNGLFERIISMGILPGEKIKIMGVTPSHVVVEIKNKKFVLDNDIAKKIKVLEYEKS